MRMLSQAATTLVMNMLQGDGGLTSSWLGQDSQAPIVVIGNKSAEIEEGAMRVRYPRVYVFCSRIENRLTEKFRAFSGVLRMVIEVRASSDRLETLEEQIQQSTDAVADVLERHRGYIAEGVFLTGRYDIVYDSVRRGGQHYLQSAQLILELEMSRA
jgi:hypothetical protein